MAIPSEYRTTSRTVGDSNIKHPIYTFTVNLDRLNSESVGPNTNLSSGTVLHPDMHDRDADRGRSNIANHQTSNLSWLPGFLTGENVVINDNGTITAYGQKALYLKREYADIENPLLTLTNDAPYTSA